MKSIRLIVTHPGGAHKDDFLACSLLLHFWPVTVHRRDPTDDELEDPTVCVVDIGHRHEPEKMNFDHHQFSNEHPPTCALSLALLHLKLYEDAKQFCDWLEPAEFFDCLGGRETARRIGAPPEVVNQLASPIDIALLKGFAQRQVVEPTDPIWQIMKIVGDDLVDYLKSLRTRLEFIEAHAEFWTVATDDLDCKVLYMPRTEPLPAEPSTGLERFIESKSDRINVVGMVYPDRRGSGYGLSRYNDNARLDFTRLKSCDDVHFSHKRGFVAKTSARDPQRLKELIRSALL